MLAVNTELDKQVSNMHRGAVVPFGHTPVFKNLLDWLDRNILEICNDNSEKVYTLYVHVYKYHG